MQAWEYAVGDVVLIWHKGQEVEAKIAGFADSLDVSRPAMVVLRTPTGRWKKESIWNLMDIVHSQVIGLVQQGPKQPLEEKDAEIERLRLGITVVRGCIIGALAGGHMDGEYSGEYGKNVLYQIAEALGIDIPDIVKGERRG